MSLIFKSLSGYELISLANGQFQLAIETPEGWKNVELNTLRDFFNAELASRIAALEANAPGNWPVERLFEVTGDVVGSTSMDGSQDISITLNVPDGALSVSAVTGLASQLLGLRLDVDTALQDSSDALAQLAQKLGINDTAVAAEKLATARNINGVPFDGTQDITLPSGDKTYEHQQSVASDIWYVHHALGKKPSVTVIDSAGTIVNGAVEYVDDDNLRINFAGAMSGLAYIN